MVGAGGGGGGGCGGGGGRCRRRRRRNGIETTPAAKPDQAVVVHGLHLGHRHPVGVVDVSDDRVPQVVVAH